MVFYVLQRKDYYYCQACTQKHTNVKIQDAQKNYCPYRQGKLAQKSQKGVLHSHSPEQVQARESFVAFVQEQATIKASLKSSWQTAIDHVNLSGEVDWGVVLCHHWITQMI